jgi:hypothetical protein
MLHIVQKLLSEIIPLTETYNFYLKHLIWYIYNEMKRKNNL